MKTTGMLATVFALAALAAPSARAGLLEDLKNAAKQEAENRAKQKLAEMAAKAGLPPAAPKEPQDMFIGEYAGTFTPASGPAVPATGTVVGYLEKAKDAWSWDVVLTAKADGEAKPAAEAKLKGAPADGKVTLSDGGWSGEIADGKLVASAGGGKTEPAARVVGTLLGLAAPAGGGKFELRLTVRKSPTLGARPPAGAVVLLPFEEGKPTNLEAWNNQNWQIMPDGSVLVKGGNNTTKRNFQSFKLHVEFRCPYMPAARGQGRGNSGVYMHGKYEVQVLDSFGLAPKDNECGGIYSVSVPKVNASLPPGQWQTYDVVFQAAKFDDKGEVLQHPMFLEVVHNGVKIHENVMVDHVTTAGMGKGHSVTGGPLMLQDHGNPVRYRNIWLVETK